MEQQKFECIKNLVMNGTGAIAFFAGSTYYGTLVEKDYYELTSELGPGHGMPLDSMIEYFNMTYVLPKNWYIRSNKEIDAILCKWRGCGHTDSAETAILLSTKMWMPDSQLNFVKRTVTNLTEITWEQFKKYVLKEEEFVLPEKWCIKSGEPEVAEYCRAYWNHKRSYNTDECKNAYAHFPPFDGGVTTSYYIKSGYTEITFEQFKKYVLKQKEEKTVEKKIIGYKLVKEEYREAAAKIAKVTTFTLYNDTHLSVNSDAEHCLRKAGVLNLWFEPVYEEEKYNIGDWITITDLKQFVRGCSALGRGTFQVIKYNGRYNRGLTIQEDGFFVKKGEDVWKINGDFAAATKEEILAAKYPFKLGDWIYAEKGSRFIDYRESTNIPTFKLGEITPYDNHSDLWLRAKVGDGNGVRASICRLATAQEIAKATVPVVNIKGCTVQFLTDGKVKFSCQSYDKEFILTLVNALRQNEFDAIDNYDGESLFSRLEAIEKHLLK